MLDEPRRFAVDTTAETCSADVDAWEACDQQLGVTREGLHRTYIVRQSNSGELLFQDLVGLGGDEA